MLCLLGHRRVGNKTSAPQTFNVVVPKHLSKGPVAKLFNRSLQAQGFTGTRPRVTSGTHLAIKAFRKVNGMSWSEAYSPAIFRTLLEGKGAFKPRFVTASTSRWTSRSR